MTPFFAIPYPIIDPVLIQIGPIEIRWYALAYIFGILLGWFYGRRLVGNDALWGSGGSPISRRRADDFIVFVTIGIVAGGRIGYVLIYDLQKFIDEPLSILALWEGGMSFHGGLIGVVLATILFARFAKVPTLSLIDVVAIVAPIGLFLGRLANFINAELYGRATDVPWAMVFPSDPAGLERHPSQLYEAGLEGLALFAVMWALAYRGKWLTRPGFISGAFVACYGAARTFGEFFREPDPQIGFLANGLTMGMLLSIPMILFGVGVMIWAARRKGPAPTAA